MHQSQQSRLLFSSAEMLKKVSKGARIRNRYNQVPHMIQATNGKVTNSQLEASMTNSVDPDHEQSNLGPCSLLIYLIRQ